MQSPRRQPVKPGKNAALIDTLWPLFEEHLFEAPPAEGLFNPYRDQDPELDRPGAVGLRRENFRSYLRCYDARPRLLLVAEAPGPWGCRFSGVPLTSEAQLADPDFPIHGHPTSRGATPHQEYSARIYWRVLEPYFPRFFTWNSVPFHPFKPGRPLSIRTPRRSEVLAYAPLLRGVLDAARPERTLAIGRKAEQLLGHVGAPCTYVRHPSQGGAKRFADGVRAVVEEMGI